MQLLDFGLLGSKLHSRLLIISILIVLKLSYLQLERLYLFDLQRDSNMCLITLLLLGLEGEALLAELFADRAVLLQHNLLILRQFAKF